MHHYQDLFLFIWVTNYFETDMYFRLTRYMFLVRNCLGSKVRTSNDGFGCVYMCDGGIEHWNIIIRVKQKQWVDA